MTRFAQQTEPQFSRQQLGELVSEAKRLGCKVMVHANGEDPVRTAIKAGCHSIEHGFFMGRQNLELMAEKGVYWVPTIYTMKAYALNAEHYRASIDVKVVEQNLAHQLEQVALARELGVKVALGTDSGSIGVLHGESMMEEMKLFMRAGFSLAETIGCATKQGAQLLGCDRFGHHRTRKAGQFSGSQGDSVPAAQEIDLSGNHVPQWPTKPGLPQRPRLHYSEEIRGSCVQRQSQVLKLIILNSKIIRKN